jgi:hypothetical protein
MGSIHEGSAHTSRMIDKARSGWPDWLGGVALIAPIVIGAGLETFGPARSKFGGVAAFSLVLSVLLIEALTAPLVGYSRPYVLWTFLPIWGWVIPWRMGTRLARLARTGSWEVAQVPALASQ